MFMKYKQKKQYRLSAYDYSQEGGYFVTICTKDKQIYFGDVVDGCMKLSRIGEIAKQFWLQIPIHFKSVVLDEFVIMPNHIHGIILITDRRNVPRHVPTTGIRPLAKDSLSSIINHYKGNVRRWCNKNGFEPFSWQPRFYDHVIRDEKSLSKIRQYITNNPPKWEIDKNNVENLYM